MSLIAETLALEECSCLDGDGGDVDDGAMSLAA